MDYYYVLIPAYEPDQKLLEIVDELDEQAWEEKRELEIILVDDGSKSELAKEVFSKLLCQSTGAPAVTILRHPQNRGKGAALRTGLAYLQEKNPVPGVVLLMDADGQHKVADGMRLAKRCLYGPDGLYLGSRDFVGKIPLRSKLGNQITNRVFSILCGRQLKDTQTGLRAFCTAYVDCLLQIKGDRYEYEMRMLMELSSEGRHIYEIPIETVYEGKNESSHFKALRDSARIYRVLLGQVFLFAQVGLVSFAIDYLFYAALLAGGLSLLPSNILSRVLSASLNYTMNRQLVFADRRRIARSLPKYVLTALLVLSMDSSLLSLLSLLGMGNLWAKALTEIFVFTGSYLLQRYFVFAKRKRRMGYAV